MSETLRVGGLVDDSIVDGPGLRLAVFAQGCPHRCPGCHNPQSHDPAGGYEMNIREIAERAKKNPLLSGVTLTGGEPMEQAEACLHLVEMLPEGLSVWVYSGYRFEDLVEDDAHLALLSACEVLVDGLFLQSERSLELRFRGSRNQRVIDLKKSFATGEIVLWEAPKW